MTTEAVGADRLREMLAGCEGVTPGSWARVEPGVGQTLVETPNGTLCEIAWRRPDVGNAHRDAAHIANCDPQTIASIITELLALRSATPAPLPAGGDEVEAAALGEFTDYFVKNYPGPDTVIGNPRWHAPKIFRAARYALRKALAAACLSPPLQGEAGGVRVKPLEWQTPSFGRSDDMYRAETLLGTYRAWTHREAGGKWFWHLSGVIDGSAADAASAKAAAQADYDQRIRSDDLEFTPAVSVPDGAEPFAWCGESSESRKFTAIRRVAEIWGEQGLRVTPLYAFQPPPALGEGSEAPINDTRKGQR